MITHLNSEIKRRSLIRSPSKIFINGTGNDKRSKLLTPKNMNHNTHNFHDDGDTNVNQTLSETKVHFLTTSMSYIFRRKQRTDKAIYLPTKFSKTELFPADCPPTTAICGKSNVIWTPSCVKASCNLFTIGISCSIPVFPDIFRPEFALFSNQIRF